MAHSNHKNTFSEQLWNVSLLPALTTLPRRCSDQPHGPGPQGGGTALRSAAVLSLSSSETESLAFTAQAA
jgi:hypothetical protein